MAHTSKAKLKAKPKIAGAEVTYSRSLRQVSNHIQKLIDAYHPHEYESVHELLELLRKYSQALRPWARRVAMSMLADVNKRDEKLWLQLTGEIGSQLRNDIRRTQLGVVMRKLLDSQVELITSLPTQAGQRVHERVLRGLESGQRAETFVKEIEETGGVSESRARLIARTEVGRASTTLSQARAGQIGATHYIWRTVEDGDVRPGHAAMDGRVCEWANPPAVLENGRVMHFHPGAIWNCRCWPETIIPDLT